MQIIKTVPALRAELSSWRTQAQQIALVPTMGNLHGGHLSLIELAQTRAERVIVSLYINPLQFDLAADLASYPVTLEQDLHRLEASGIDAVFVPDDRAIYPAGSLASTRIDVVGLTDILCGAHRPGHFVGVATVVCKLLNIVQPDCAVFGEKDRQQLLVVRRLVADLHMPVEIVGAPIRREHDGLAMSSRNVHLSSQERAQAPYLYQLLQTCVGRILAGEAHGMIENDAMRELSERGFVPDYVAIRCQDNLMPPDAATAPDALVVLVGATLGSTRLIDNLPVTAGEQV